MAGEIISKVKAEFNKAIRTGIMYGKVFGREFFISRNSANQYVVEFCGYQFVLVNDNWV